MSEVRKRRAEESAVDQFGDKESSPKRPALGFSFRPSPLNQATKSFALKQSSLLSTSADEPCTSAGDVDSTQPQQPTGAFLRLNSDDITPITITAPTIMTTGVVDGNSHLEVSENHSNNRHDNPFLQFLTDPNTTTQTFSSLVREPTSSSTPAQPAACDSTTDTSTDSLAEGQPENRPESSSGPQQPSTPTVPFGSQPTTALLPEVQTPTGEEGEKKIVQIPARLYAFDAPSHTWLERGRGEVRLNDACQRENVFQSRLVMRQSGSYRVLLNTHLWAQMKCEKASQKSIRITAQHGEGEVSVFLMTGAVKDVQQLYSSIEQRIEALKINVQHANEAEKPASRELTPPSSEAGDSPQKGYRSSPDSSPESHLRRLVPRPREGELGGGAEDGSKVECTDSPSYD